MQIMDLFFLRIQVEVVKAMQVISEELVQNRTEQQIVDVPFLNF